MRRIVTLNRYFVLTLALALVAVLLASTLSWLTTLEARGAMLRESRFQFSLSNVRSAVDSGLELGLLLPDLPGVQDLIERNRLQESGILSIDIFDVDGRIVFTTDNGGVSATLPEAWLAPCLASRQISWHTQDEEGDVLCSAVVNGYEKAVGGVVLRYRVANRAGTLGVLGSAWPQAALAILVLLTLGICGGWLAVRERERRWRRGAAAIRAQDAIVDGTTIDGAIGPLSVALARLSRIEHALSAADREADRLDNLS